VGAWPIDAGRVKAYMEKATREAKAFTAWTRIDEAWEEALRRFIDGVLADPEITAGIEAFVAPLVEPGRINSLALTLLRLTCPGIPDTYQGSELWDLSLVDPDNRRPVDYELRRKLLRELKKGLAVEKILDRTEEGLPKLWLLRQGLHLRRRHPEAFGPKEEYRPLAVSGARAEHAVAFARGGEVVAIAPRLVLGLGGDWKDTAVELPEGSWRNELTGEEVEGGERRIGDLLRRFPVALLARGRDRVS
jgi:(1->4)-alpha-D-glucan 1-alpha-D-glucosylmutase